MTKNSANMSFLSFLSKEVILGGVGAVVILVGSFYHWKAGQIQNQRLKTMKKPKEIEWLDEDSYLAFAAICDTIFPSLSTSQCTEAKLKASLDQLQPDFFDKNRRFFEKLLSATNGNNEAKSDVQAYKKYLFAGALELSTPKHAAEALQLFGTSEDHFQLRLILKLLSTSIGCFLLTGNFAPITMLPLATRERILHGFRDSRWETFRTLFQIFKRLVCVVYYSYAERGEKNPAWEVLQYYPEATVNQKLLVDPSSSGPESDDVILKKMITYPYVFEHLHGKVAANDIDELAVDAVIVGSGCGGGVMAEQLVQAGYTVLVLEKGGYFQATDFARWREYEAMGNLYEKGGLRTNEGGSVVILSGSCVGGGSTVNWSASFRPSDIVLEDWEKAGLSQFKKGGEFEKSLDFILQRMNVNCDHSYYDACESQDKTFAVNENNRLLWKSANSLGFIPEKIPRNVKNCVNCGSCCFGCSHKSKQSTIHTIMEPLLLEQYRSRANPTSTTNGKKAMGKLYIIPDCKVSHVTHTVNPVTGKKTATGVEAVVTLFDPQLNGLARTALSTRKLRVKAKVTIAAAGSIYTPALLLNSHFTHPKIGRYLTLHPVLGAAGFFPEVQRTGLETGVSMGVVVKKPLINAAKHVTTAAEQQLATRHNLAIETPPLHLGLLGLLLPWQNGLQFKLVSMFYQQTGVFIGISRDHCLEENRVVVDNEGNPKIFYSLSQFDETSILTGLETEVRMIYAAGAEFILTGNTGETWFNAKQYPTIAENDKALEAFIAQIWRERVVPNKLTVFSAHQMSSCRMAANPAEGPTSPTGELYECEDLFVADGSVCPTSLGINPMMTIEALSHLISKNVIHRLQQKKQV